MLTSETPQPGNTLLGLKARATLPWWVFALLALVPALSGTARGLIVPALKVSDLVVCILAVALVVMVRVSWRNIDALGFAILLYGVLHATFTVINFVRRPELELLDLPKELVSGGQYFVIYMIALLVSKHARSPLTWLKWTSGVAAAIGIIAALQELNVPGIREVMAFLTGNPRIVSWLEWQDSRATGPFFSWHALGIYLAIHSAILIAVLIRSNLVRRDFIFLGVSLVSICFGLVASLTLTPALLFGIAVLVFVPWRMLFKGKLLWATGAALLVIGSAVIAMGPQILERVSDQGESVIPGLPRTIAYRIMFWTEDYLPIVRENLLTGYGPLSSQDTIYPHTESMYVTVLMAGGIVLLIAFLWFSWVAIREMKWASTILRDQPLSRAIAGAALLTSVFLVVAQTIHPYMDDAGGAPLFMVILGIVAGQVQRASERPEFLKE